MKKKLLLTLLTLLGLSFLAAPAYSDAHSDARADDTVQLAGRYMYAGGADERHRLRSTVDELVSRFNPLIRGLARRRLRSTIRVPEGVVIASKSTEGVVAVEVLGVPGFGEDAAFENGTLVQHLSSFEGTRTTRFELSEDGLRLTLRVTTRSTLLPDTLDYKLR